MDGISDAAVFAYANAANKMKLAAVVGRLNKDEILDFLKEQLYHLEIPGKIILRKSIPHNHSGKPDYDKLRSEIQTFNTFIV